MRKLLIAAATLTVMLCGCAEDENRAAATPPPVEVVIHKVEVVDVPVEFEFVGKTISSRKVEIRSRVQGFLDKRLYEEGGVVTEGQPMFQMDTKPFAAQLRAAQAELAQQQARLENAQTNLSRVNKLIKTDAVAQKEVDDAQADYRTAAAAVEVAKANVIQAELELGYTRITSPVNGISSYAHQQEGAYVGIGNSLLTYVAQIDPMWIEFSVSENQVLALREKAKNGVVTVPKKSNFQVEILLADGSKFPHTGFIAFADASISEDTGTFLLRAELVNPDNFLKPGQFVRAMIKGATRPNAVLVPKRAVQQSSKGSYVWVVNEKGEAEFRPVKLGPWHDQDWFIEQGLMGGDQVVVDGVLRLRAGCKVIISQPKPAETVGKAS